jgi:hypothetical protein
MAEKSLFKILLNNYMEYFKKQENNQIIKTESPQPTQFFDLLNNIKLLGYLTKINSEHRAIIEKHNEEKKNIEYEHYKRIMKLDKISDNSEISRLHTLMKEALDSHHKQYPQNSETIVRISKGKINNLLLKISPILSMDLNKIKKHPLFKQGQELTITYNKKNNNDIDYSLPQDISFGFIPVEMRKVYKNGNQLIDRTFTISDVDFVMDNIHLTEEWQKFILELIPDNLKRNYLEEIENYNKNNPSL